MPFDYLKSYQTFTSITEMDEVVAGQLSRHVLTQAECAVLLRIAQSALKYPGAAHLKACTIAASINVSTKTVYRAVKRLAALKIITIIASTKKNGIKGANLYQIVPSAMSTRVPSEQVRQDADAAPLFAEETSSFNLLQTSNVNEMYKNTAYLNDWQKILYDLMMGLPICDELKDGLYAAIVATPIDTAREFTTARDTLLVIIRDVQHGRLTIQTTLRAIYKGAYNKRSAHPKIAEPVETTGARPAAFYDWLVIREGEKE